MCIILYVLDSDAKIINIVQRIQRVFYDGEDGRGIGGILTDGSWHLMKGVDLTPIEVVAELNRDYMNGAIIHLRIATAGAINYINTQPILSMNERVLLAHNGDFTSKAKVLLGFLKGVSERYRDYQVSSCIIRANKPSINNSYYYYNYYAYPLLHLQDEDSDGYAVSDSWVLTEFIGVMSKFYGEEELARAIYEMNVGNVVVQFRDGTVYFIGSFAVYDDLISTVEVKTLDGYYLVGILKKKVNSDLEIVLQDRREKLRAKFKVKSKKKKKKRVWRNIAEFFTRYI